jgi:putative membrane protein
MESPLTALKRFLIGMLLGIISVVPGVSGVVLAVTFGVYERIVEDIADIRHKIREDFRFLITIGLGLVFGIFLISAVFSPIGDKDGPYYIPAMLLFFGMILGQLPQLWKFTMPQIKPSKKDIAALVIGVFIMCLLLFFRADEITLGHDPTSILLMVLVGVIYAISHIAPGISGSTLLLAFGLLFLTTGYIASLDVVLLIPLLVGTIIGLIGFAKVVHYALVHYRKPTYMMIFGFTIGSIFIVLKEAYSPDMGATDLAIGVVALIVGVIVSLWFSKIGKKTSHEMSTR